MNCLDKIDWDLLATQKATLLHVIYYANITEEQRENLQGIVHLLDALQDEVTTN